MLRVAIVGLGPKGMYALERLLEHASTLEAGAGIEVDAFEPHPAPGAGPIYDPGQPSYLRMNFAADAVDMWHPTSSTVPPAERLSFDAWRELRSPACDRDIYAARALVGRYLADGLETMLRNAPASTRIQLRQARIRVIRWHGGGWELAPEGPDGVYDEVLIATGHDQSGDSSLASAWEHSASLVPTVYPVGRSLGPERVPAGATVAVRGFALSFIDAALALTQGRGGSFVPAGDGYRMHYSPTDSDAGLILPFSRTGRPMLAKPGPGLAAGVPALEPIAERGREQLLHLPAGFDLRHDLLPILAATTRANLVAAGDRTTRAAADHAGAWLARAAGGLPRATVRDPSSEIERSLAIGMGVRVPDLQWALGHTWRALYPALVQRLGGDRLAERDWPAFHRLATEMERVAFGPPPCNAAKLLALIDAGRIDLQHVRGARLVGRGAGTRLRSDRGERAIDVVVDAVLADPGARDAKGGLLRGLLDAGHARVLPGRRGLDVGPDGGCRGENGLTTPGLSAIGRPTEDAVIGNDTLSRALHPLADHWARRVVQRSREEASGATVGAPSVEIG